MRHHWANAPGGAPVIGSASVDGFPVVDLHQHQLAPLHVLGDVIHRRGMHLRVEQEDAVRGAGDSEPGDTRETGTRNTGNGGNWWDALRAEQAIHVDDATGFVILGDEVGRTRGELGRIKSGHRRQFAVRIR